MGLEHGSLRALEVDACAEILAASFGGSVDVHRARLALRRGSVVDALHDAQRLIGSIRIQDRRAVFGARFVCAAYLSSLCVDPNARGRGHGFAIVAEELRRARARGVPLALLHAARTDLYERLGFAVGGARWVCEFDPRAIVDVPRGSSVRAQVRGDEDELDALVRSTTRAHRGRMLETRCERRRASRTPRECFVLEHSGKIAGRLVISPPPSGMDDCARIHALDVRDDDVRSARRLLSIVAERSARALWRVAPDESLAESIPIESRRFRERGAWMLRVVDPRLALAARGFDRALDVSLELEIEDALLPENSGCFVLAIRNGRGQLARGGSGGIHVDAAELARAFAGASRTNTAPSAERALLDFAFAAPNLAPSHTFAT